METKSSTTSLLVLSVVLAVLGAARFDWMSVAAELLLIIDVRYLYRKKLVYHEGFLKAAILTNLVLALAMTLDFAGFMSSRVIDHVSVMWMIHLLPLAVLVFIIGTMSIIILDRFTDSSVSRRWMIVFAMVFTFAFSGIYMFAIGFHIWYSGQPFTNEDIQTYGRVTNSILMAAPCCFCITGIVCGIIGRQLMKSVSKDLYLTEVL